MQKKLEEVIISITKRCNSSCRMCQIPSFDERVELSTEQVKKFIQEVAILHPRNIVFSGGEPLLRSDILELIALSRRCGFIACLTSNGRLIDTAMAGGLKDAGINVVNISVDGPKEAHDYLRGEGSFELAVRALENLAAQGIETTIAMFVCRQNYKYMPYIINLAAESKATTVKFQAFNDIFLKDKNMRNEFLIPVEKLDDVRASVQEAIEQAHRYKIAINPPQYLKLLPHYLCRTSKPTRQSRSMGCLSLWQSCPVDTSGQVYPCWIYSDKPIGNVVQESILDIWNSKKHQKIRRDITLHGCPECFLSCYDARLNSDVKGGPSIKMRFLYLKKFGFSFVLRRKFLSVGRSFIRLRLSNRNSLFSKRPGEEAAEREDFRQLKEEELRKVERLNALLEEKIKAL